MSQLVTGFHLSMYKFSQNDFFRPIANTVLAAHPFYLIGTEMCFKQSYHRPLEPLYWTVEAISGVVVPMPALPPATQVAQHATTWPHLAHHIHKERTEEPRQTLVSV